MNNKSRDRENTLYYTMAPGSDPTKPNAVVPATPRQVEGLIRRFALVRVSSIGSLDKFHFCLEGIRKIYSLSDVSEDRIALLALTQRGDKVSFMLSPEGHVQVSSFRNLTLESET